MYKIVNKFDDVNNNELNLIHCKFISEGFTTDGEKYFVFINDIYPLGIKVVFLKDILNWFVVHQKWIINKCYVLQHFDQNKFKIIYCSDDGEIYEKLFT